MHFNFWLLYYIMQPFDNKKFLATNELRGPLLSSLQIHVTRFPVFITVKTVGWPLIQNISMFSVQSLICPC